MPISTFARPTPRKPLSLDRAGRGSRRSRGAFYWMIIFGLAGCLVWLIFQNGVQSELAQRLQERINAQLQGTLLLARINKAEFISGEGIRLTDAKLAMVDPSGLTDSAPVSFEFYEAFIKLPVTMPQLLTGTVAPAAVRVRRAKIRLMQNSDGDWNLPEFVAQLSSLNAEGSARIPLSFTDCSIELVSTDTTRPPVIFSDVSLNVTPVVFEHRPLIEIKGEFNAPDVAEGKILIYLDEPQRTWQGHVQITKFVIHPNIIALLPAKLSEEFSRWPTIEGRLQGMATLAGNIGVDDSLRYDFQGHLSDFVCEDPNLPLPIRNMNLDFSVTNHSVKLDNVSGRLGNSRFRVKGIWQRQAFNPSWQVEGSIDQFDCDQIPKFLGWLPESYANLYHQYLPSGKTDMNFLVGDHSSGFLQHLSLSFSDMSFLLAAFPYPFKKCGGNVHLTPEICRVHIQSQPGAQRFICQGSIENPGPGAKFHFDMSAPDGLIIDEKFYQALSVDTKMADVVQAFRPFGQMLVEGSVSRNVIDGPVEQEFDLELVDCAVRHRNFDYPIYNLYGKIEFRNKDLRFVSLSGGHGPATLTAAGKYSRTQGLDVRFNCQSVPVDHQLRDALPADFQEVWRGIQPRGMINMADVRMFQDQAGEPLQVHVDAYLKKNEGDSDDQPSVSIKPVWFPYQIDDLVGQISLGGGKVKLTNMSGKHGRSWFAWQASGSYDESNWAIKFQNLVVGSLKLNEDLLMAVPTQLAQAIGKLQFNGQINLQGDVTISGQRESARPPLSSQVRNLQETRRTVPSHRLDWDLRMDLNQAALLIGIPVNNVFGSVYLKGGYDGSNVLCSGDLALDSLMIYDSQITNVSGPIWIDNMQTRVGVFATDQNAGDLPSMESANRAAGRDPIQSANPRSLIGSVNGGVLKLDAQVYGGQRGEFYLQTTLADADFCSVCGDHAPGLADVKGRAYMALRLTGNSLGTHSLRGNGSIQLRQAELYQLPVILSVLKSLRVGSRTRSAFDSSNIDFLVNGREIELSRFEMLGEPISLLGNGKVDFDRNIDLNFYSVVGKNRFHLPIISDLYKASSQQVLWINVDGTLDQPQTHRNVLPQLNDTLKQLFQPIEYDPNQLPWGWNQPYQRNLSTAPATTIIR